MFSLYEMIAITAGYVTQQPFEVMAFSLGMFHTLSIALWWHLSHLVAICSTEGKIGLVHHLADERRCEYIWWSCCRSCGKIPQAFSLHALLHTTSDQELEVQKLGLGMRLVKGRNGLSSGQITHPVNTLLAVEEVKLKIIPNHILTSPVSHMLWD